jgi:hypothetical protein
MNVCVRLLMAAFVANVAFSPLPASAESLRCSGGIVAEGDSRVSVSYKCGQPLAKDSYCAPVYYVNSMHPLPEVIGNYYVPCQASDDWLYDRGPGNLMATVRFRSGTVQSITYGRLPR